MTWTPSAGATAYVVEIGSASGASDVATTTVTAPSFLWQDARIGQSFLRVKARNAEGTSGASVETPVVVPDWRDYVEGIFLGAGPLRTPEADDNCAQGFDINPEIMAGFARGTTVVNKISTAIDPRWREVMRQTLAQVSEASDGAIQTVVEITDDTVPAVGSAEVGHAVSPTLIAECSPIGCCSASALACYTPFFVQGRAGRFHSGRALFRDGVLANTGEGVPFAHEIGHIVLGFCHVNAQPLGRQSDGTLVSLMGFGTAPLPNRLTPFDIEAARAVYRAGLTAGATRSDFQAAGVIK
ncbi:MAG TPA: hypothetical protein VES67_26730 [Vicinamibacterales bacterium]|nr:hypothetical protein [Vicinamibacterales bacterium]